MTFWEIFNSLPTFVILVILALSILFFVKPHKRSSRAK
ncbi:MAG: hypothetical protein US80_C0004G0010 [Candidatus Daviesbacteria bacterium GW2011_GWA2_38_17]|uniref:Uncharacterized protein n=1 Tax=Candidatus Daviesbacteria bacterium GW2011_GWF2_38_6 TaxID=1618432 RepID=A0A0G0KJ04_9BACT|nr:MAG: hypothetical protein US80_C0004G0010 [Candidatus Daviesbacteria bacterium GW2011_GWA2_38_17]KKQ78747.1 MAG: hypothetical protein US99_C0012G0004 [Candidatus Daviesbacteria bacterium GW2011_GWF2_38_6]